MERFKTYYKKLNEVSNYNGILSIVIDDFKKHVKDIFPNGTYKIDFTKYNYPELKDITVVLNNKLDGSYIKIKHDDGHFFIYLATQVNNIASIVGSLAHELTHVSQMLSGFFNYEYGKKSNYGMDTHSTYEFEHEAALVAVLVMIGLMNKDEYDKDKKLYAELNTVFSVTEYPEYFMKFPFKHIVKSMAKLGIDPRLFIPFRENIELAALRDLRELDDDSTVQAIEHIIEQAGKLIDLLKIWNYNPVKLEREYAKALKQFSDIINKDDKQG